MDTFTLDPRCWRIGRVFGRNPLLRRADRIEALVTLVALMMSLVAIPVAGVVGIAVYDARDSRYVREAHERHTVTATVAEAGPGGSSATVVQARWPVAPGERSGWIQLTTAAKAGDHISIWVDTDGNPVAPPTPTWHSVGDAIGTAIGTLLIAVVGITSLTIGICSGLNRARNAQWDRELGCLEGDGGRTNQR